MELGFFLDRKRNGADSLAWIEGKPERSVMTGVQLKGRKAFHIDAFRCPTCGLVLGFARELAGKQGEVKALS